MSTRSHKHVKLFALTRETQRKHGWHIEFFCVNLGILRWGLAWVNAWYKIHVNTKITSHYVKLAARMPTVFFYKLYGSNRLQYNVMCEQLWLQKRCYQHTQKSIYCENAPMVRTRHVALVEASPPPNGALWWSCQSVNSLNGSTFKSPGLNTPRFAMNEHDSNKFGKLKPGIERDRYLGNIFLSSTHKTHPVCGIIWELKVWSTFCLYCWLAQISYVMQFYVRSQRVGSQNFSRCTISAPCVVIEENHYKGIAMHAFLPSRLGVTKAPFVD